MTSIKISTVISRFSASSCLQVSCTISAFLQCACRTKDILVIGNFVKLSCGQMTSIKISTVISRFSASSCLQVSCTISAFLQCACRTKDIWQCLHSYQFSVLDKLYIENDTWTLLANCLLFESYLKDWTETVQIGSCTATPATLKYGVPQGSVLGPILFTMYPSWEYYSKTWVELYADDTQ